VGAIYYGDEVEGFIPARSGRRQVLQILHRMTAREAAAGGRQTDLAELLRAAERFVRRRSLIFVVSDFFSTPGWPALLGRLAQRHEVVAVRLHDALEAELPDLGLLSFRDAETGEQLFVDTHDRGFRKRFAVAAARREALLRESFAEAGVDALELSTDADLAEEIRAFVELRRRRGRLNTHAAAAA
jgi:uncharacterized protein (DUF58 family)